MRRTNHNNPDAVASFPNVLFIPFDTVTAQQLAQFIPESDSLVMLFLMSDISFDLF
jgi:hypothetical protein